MQVRAYVGGKAIELPNASNLSSAVLEVELPDGRTVQFSVNDKGSVRVRGWGNIPAKVGNCQCLTLDARMLPEVASTCEVCYHKLALCGCKKSKPIS